MSVTGLGMPYMGSKRKLAPKIITHILKENTKAKYFYDLFGGGGAISFMALQAKQIKEVNYNEYNPAIVNLLKYIVENGVTDECYKWVSREEFKKNLSRTDWYGGLMTIMWSFGNSGKTYLFGKDLEHDKKLLHEIVVDNNINSINKFKDKFDFNFSAETIHNTFVNKSIEQRRVVIARIVKNKANRLDNQQLQQLEQLERLKQLKQLQQLEQLEQLERLKRLGRIEKLKITNLSYEEVEINTPVEETILYLDPPYKNTASYNKTIDFSKLQEFIKKSKYKIYLSEYNNTYDMRLVNEYKHRGTLSGGYNNEVIEKLFCNR